MLTDSQIAVAESLIRYRLCEDRGTSLAILAHPSTSAQELVLMIEGALTKIKAAIHRGVQE